ncbi:MAG: transcriptional regulator [Polyangiaceae bacterium]|nr:transcriptional regulator [Polyangiaceae bacterium]
MLNQSPPLDRVFHALSDASRRVMLERLSRGPASSSEARPPGAAPMRLGAPKANAQKQSLAEQWITERRSLWERRLDRLGALLDEEEEEQGNESKKRKNQS